MKESLPVLGESSPTFRTQIIWEPDMNDGDLQASINEAMEKAYFMQAWLDGRLETDVFFDYLDNQRIDVFDLPIAWNQQGLII